MKNMKFIEKLPIPMQVKEQYPITEDMEKIINRRNAEISDVFLSNNDKMVLIIGPCSADSEDSVLDYISRLVRVQEKVNDKLVIIPRIYTNKPRTTGSGYKGMLHQPDPDKAPDLLKGIIAIRELHSRAVKETGFTCADEMLYPSNYRYLNDILGYVAVGARSVENQEHRLTASGIDVPVGMKNPTSGDISIMLNSVTAAQHGHSFIYRGWSVQTSGNPLTHAILRGYVNRQGKSLPNFHYEDLINLYENYLKSGLANPAVIIDTNHANSAKKYLDQPRIAKEVLLSCKNNREIRKFVKGFMIESYIEDGAQEIGGKHIYGKSITDPCLGWEKTEKLIYEIADMLQ